MRHKQFTALLLSAIVTFSSCIPVSLHAFAAEGSAVEDDGGQLPEESRESEDTVEEEDDSDSNAGADAAVDEDVEVPDEESENAADAAVDDSEAAPEDAAADVTADENEAAPEDAAADVTADENEIAPEEEPENAQTDSTETDGKGIEAEKTKADAGTETKEQEDVYLPIIVEGGAVEGTRKNSFMASSAWDAEKLASLPILETDVSSASDGCILLGLPGEYIADQQAVLDRINEIRREACEEGVTNPETGRPLTMADYVPLKWSYELEEISRIRAAEVSMTADHERTNGDNWQSMDSEYWYVGECAAWNYGRSATSGIEQWYNEKDYWLEGNSNKSGHYTTLIRPAMRHVGGATFYSRFTQYPNTTLIEFYTEEGVDESFVDMTGECIQMLEVSEANLNGNPSIIGTLSGVKNDEQPLYLVTNAKYSGMFTAYAHNLVFLDDVSWNSSNSGIAAVTSDGIVKAGKCGSATITAQAENGSSAEAEFTVDHVLQKIPAVDPTCTATGLTEGEKCANCGTVTIKQETIAAKGHSYGSWTVTKKATCTAAGSRKKTCTACGNVVTEKIPATGHKWETEYTVDTAATCTVDGSESIHCSVCDAINSSTVRAISKTGHSYGSWKVTKKATCTEKGSRERVCTKCGDKVTQAIAATGHKWKTEYTIDTAATCTAAGSESIHCSVCDAIDSSTVRAIPAKGHSYGSWTVTKKATCTAAGSRKKTCNVCGNVVTEKIATTGHKWETEYTVDTAATCTAAGSESIHCSVCDAINSSTVRAISKTGHSYGSWKVTKKATCTEKGSRERVCTKCGDKVTQAIAATGHKWETEYTVDKAATCTAEGSESIHCSVCDAINSSTVRAIPMTAHTYGKWTVTKEPTCTEKGTKVRTCNVCGKKETKSIPVLTPGWKQDANGWKYLRPDTTYPKSQFEVIEEKTYYFNDSEYRVTGLQEIEGAKYYFNEDGVMQTGWQTIDGEKYFFDENGAAHIGWLKSGDDWYYFRLTGVMHTGSLKKNGIYYYLRKDGTRLSGWLQVGGKIFYYKLNGERLTGWLQKNGKKFYFKTNGEMHTGWLKLNGKYYYFKENGQMVTGRYKIGNKWFTFNSNGVRQ